MNFEWNCPFCDRASIVTDANYSQEQVWMDTNTPNAHGAQMLQVQFFVCPNPKCKEFVLVASLHPYSLTAGRRLIGTSTNVWRLIPPSTAKAFPNYVPKPILEDYVEACLVRDLSPKASATLARRCLQGMIRDFWDIRKGRLLDEILELKKHVDPLTWDAIDAVRSVGNIGAHMEKDINVIVDVDPDEASKLIGLVELLIGDWYILREQRRAKLGEIVEIGKAKKDAKANPAEPANQ
jgi:uncharacterized protein DUF4145